jgi:hypothetical protein
MPLGRLRGEEALNVWEHIAFAEWLGSHRLGGHDARASVEARLFEEQTAFYELLGDAEESSELSEYEECESADEDYE